jgi:hypothetical protein
LFGIQKRQDISYNTNGEEVENLSNSKEIPLTYINWAPSLMEIASVISGKPCEINILMPHGYSMTFPIDEYTTVESIMRTKIWPDKIFKKEPDPELYWLFRYEDDSELFDWPLTKDKRLLKLIYKLEKA